MPLLLAAVPLLASALLGLGAGEVGRRLPPGPAVRVLAVSAFLTALASGFCLSVVAFDALARVPLVAALGQWSAAALGVEGTPPPVGGVVLGGLVAALLVASLRRSLRTAADLAHAAVACSRLRDVGDGLVLVDDPVPDAFAVPGFHGKVVVTTGMLRALSTAERRALVAHERAHLSHHHQLYIQAANLAAAANPLLLPLARHVRALTERWADEEAAAEVQDRMLTARALAKAALARTAYRRPGGEPLPLAMSATENGVAERALALTRPRPRSRPRLASAVLGLAVASLCAAVWMAHTTETEFEQAHAAYLAQAWPRASTAGQYQWWAAQNDHARTGEP